MRRVSPISSPKHGVRGQTIYIVMLGLATAALILTNVFLFMEYFEYYHGQQGASARIDAMADRPAATTAEPSKEAQPAEPETSTDTPAKTDTEAAPNTE